MANKPLIHLTQQLMHSNIDGSTSTIQNHDNTIFDHLLLHSFFGIFTALDGCTFRLETEEKVGAVS
jgi:hypothetical protein